MFFFFNFYVNYVRVFVLYIGTSIGLLPKATEPKRIYHRHMCLYLCLCSSVCYYRSFSCTLYNLQISRPSSYNAKLHSCIFDTLNKGLPFSPFHHATWWYGNFSLNVRGLSNNTKRRETFLWLKRKKFCIYFLQEVHSTNEIEPYWHSEWGYSTIFTTFSS